MAYQYTKLIDAYGVTHFVPSAHVIRVSENADCVDGYHSEVHLSDGTNICLLDDAEEIARTIFE